MDYIVASTSARISFGFVKMGLVPELASSRLLAQRVGPGVAAELVFTGRTIDGVEAQALGLADRVVSPESLRDAAQALGESIAANPRDTVRRIKRLLTKNLGENDLALVQHQERQALAECYASAEHKEAIRKFLA
jgi:2-(1,2-epoxy-1,2-dihydrophenyl)acetyl-CoA isomerase